MICWCPRWTPSNTPMVATARPPPGRRTLHTPPPLHQPLSSPDPAGRQDHLGPRPALTLRHDRHHPPVRPEHRVRPDHPIAASGPPCESTRASSAPTSRRGRRRSTASDRARRHRIIALGQLLQGGGLGQREAAHRGAPQRRQVAAHPQSGAEVAGDGPHVRAGGAVSSMSTSDVACRAHASTSERSMRDPAGRQVDRLALAHPRVGAHPPTLIALTALGTWSMLPDEPRQGVRIRPRRVPPAGSGDHLALGVVRSRSTRPAGRCRGTSCPARPGR
jgi:hypothetical protein